MTREDEGSRTQGRVSRGDIAFGALIFVIGIISVLLTIPARNGFRRAIGAEELRLTDWTIYVPGLLIGIVALLIVLWRARRMRREPK